MTVAADAKTTTLKLRLLREGAAFTVDSALKDGHQLREIPWRGVDGARLFVGSVFTNQPPWFVFLDAQTDNLPELLNSGCAAALFLPVANRTMAVCFGHAHMVMNTHHFENNFGLKVTLNKVARGNLRTIDSATPDATTFQRRIQASRDSDLTHFGIDYDRDLLTLASGTPDDNNFAKFLAGKDTLTITCSLSPTGVQDKCRQALEAFSATDYERDYKWVDHIQPIREDDLTDQLDALLFVALQELQTGSVNDLHLAPPEIADYTSGAELRFNGLGVRGGIFHHLTIEDYVAELDRSGFGGAINDIKLSHRVSAKAGDSDIFSEKWKVYDCFVFETEYIGATYVIFAGQWYRIDRDFATEINTFFSSLPTRTIVASTNKPNEEELIEELTRTRPDLLKLDRELVSAAGLSHDRIETCDFLSRNKEFIHLKDGHSSSPISHLWMQGVVFAEAFVASGGFRSRFRSLVRRLDPAFTSLIPDGRQRSIDRREYTVVYGIMRKPYRSGALGLPFFSKVSLRPQIQRLQTLGFSVAINLIEKR